jgi:hypothetical protein
VSSCLSTTFHSLCVFLLLDTSLDFVVWCFLNYFFVDPRPFLGLVTFVPLLFVVSSSSPLFFNLVLPPFYYFCRCERVGSFFKLEEFEGSFGKDEIVDIENVGRFFFHFFIFMCIFSHLKNKNYKSKLT